MADISIKIKAEQLGLDLENLADNLEAQFQEDIKNLAQGAYSEIVKKAQQDGGSKSMDYLKGLSFDVIGENEYLISLDGKYPNQIEDGWASYSMQDVMLKSNKIVEIGSRAGLPWVQRSKKDGHKFAHVPMEKNPFSKNPNTAAFSTAIKNMKAPNLQGSMQKLTKVFKDANGNPLTGKVAVMKKFEGSNDALKNLAGLVKYQQLVKDKHGKDKVASSYIVYRTISENGKAWRGPAFDGIKAFIEAERWLDENLSKILEVYLR